MSSIPTSDPPIPAEWIEALRNDPDGRAHRAFLGTAEQFPEMLACALPDCIDGAAWAATWRVFDQAKAGNVDWYLQKTPFHALITMGATRRNSTTVSNFILASLDDDTPGLVDLFYQLANECRELTSVPAWVKISLANSMEGSPAIFDACIPGNDLFIQQLFLSRLDYVGVDDGEGYMEPNTSSLLLGEYLDRNERFSLFARFADSRMSLDGNDIAEVIAASTSLGLIYPRAMHQWSLHFSFYVSVETLIESWPTEVRGL